jgi:hypothetical protein
MYPQISDSHAAPVVSQLVTSQRDQGNFIATILRSPEVADAVMDLLKNRDGLILGICNGFKRS